MLVQISLAGCSLTLREGFPLKLRVQILVQDKSGLIMDKMASMNGHSKALDMVISGIKIHSVQDNITI